MALMASITVLPTESAQFWWHRYDIIRPMTVAKIISGGQTGVDRAALDIALELGIPCGGWCPKDRVAEDGRIPDKYPLKETTSRMAAAITPTKLIFSFPFKRADDAAVAS